MHGHPGKRQEFGLRLGNCVSSVPQRELLIAGGDLNVQLAPFRPHIGHGTGVLSPERALDADALNHLLAAHSLVALNTWGTPGSKAHTFRFGKHQAQLDFLLMRLTDTDAQARKACPLRDCPVGSWRDGGGLHSPIMATLPFRYTQFRSSSHKPVQADIEKIVAIAKDPHRETDPIVVEFRKEVATKLQQLKTIEDVGNMISMIIQAVAAKHFPRFPPSDAKLARWQQPHIQQGIAHMWKAWRHYRRHTSNTTLKALMARWRTWMQYARLYRRHRDRCRTTKKQFLLDHMQMAEQAAQRHDQRQLYRVVGSPAPKMRHCRSQLRDATGQMLTREEEASCFQQHFTTKFTAPGTPSSRLDTWERDSRPIPSDAPTNEVIATEALANHLRLSPLRKAVDIHPVWRLCPDEAATVASSILQHHWQNDPTRVPQAWTDAYLILIRKPNKTAKEAGHYRPIGLQDELGKLTFKTIIEPYQDHIYSHTMQRSHRDALRRVFDHCHEVRTKCRAISGTLHDRYHGTAQRTLAGGGTNHSRPGWCIRCHAT